MKKVKKSPKKHSSPRRMTEKKSQYPLAFDVFIDEVIGWDVANDMRRSALERRFAKFVDSIEYEDLSSSIMEYAIWPPFATRESDPSVEKALKKALKKDGFEFVQKKSDRKGDRSPLEFPKTIDQVKKGIASLYEAGFVFFEDKETAALMIVPNTVSRKGKIINEKDVKINEGLLATMSDPDILEDISLKSLYKIIGFSLPRGDFDVIINGKTIVFELFE